jgi:ribosomal protein L10
MDGVIYTGPRLAQLATLPSKDTLLSEFVGALQSPISEFVGLIGATIQEFSGLLTARAEQMEGAA